MNTPNTRTPRHMLSHFDAQGATHYYMWANCPAQATISCDDQLSPAKPYSVRWNDEKTRYYRSIEARDMMLNHKITRWQLSVESMWAAVYADESQAQADRHSVGYPV